MGLPKIQTRVVHSESKHAWNVIGTELGSKYKIARVPYTPVAGSNILSDREKQEAYEHAVFISTCFNAAYEEEQRMSAYRDKSYPYDIQSKDLPF